MRKLPTTILAVLLCAFAVAAQRDKPATEVELSQITARGRLLAEYDVAAWHATDAVLALEPAEGSVARYIAQKSGAKWTVAFGRLNDKGDKFLVAYEATQGTEPTRFTVKRHEPPREDAGFYLVAAKAIDLAVSDFRGEQRPYNVAALPAASGQVYVYLVPAQTRQGVYPLGGDARYTVSANGTKIVENRRLHNSIIEFTPPPAGMERPEASFHTAVLDDAPEDTDVFHVLSRKPAIAEWVASRKYVYRIEPDGSIKYVMTTEAFTKAGAPTTPKGAPTRP